VSFPDDAELLPESSLGNVHFLDKSHNSYIDDWLRQHTDYR
jgi:hypothetical protein